MRGAAPVLLATALAACGAGDVPQRRVETDAELQRQDEQAYERSPDVELPELRERLLAMGIAAKDIRSSKEENEVDIFVLDLPHATFARLDKKALAKLELDSRYRFQLSDPSQSKELAGFSVAEDAVRRKERYLQELAANGEMDIFPRYRPGTSMTAYARSLEHYCGYRPGEALNVVDGRWLEYRNSMVDNAVERQRANEPGMAAFKYIVRVVYATDLQSQFVGNRGRQGATDS